VLLDAGDLAEAFVCLQTLHTALLPQLAVTCLAAEPLDCWPDVCAAYTLYLMTFSQRGYDGYDVSHALRLTPRHVLSAEQPQLALRACTYLHSRHPSAFLRFVPDMRGMLQRVALAMVERSRTHALRTLAAAYRRAPVGFTLDLLQLAPGGHDALRTLLQSAADGGSKAAQLVLRAPWPCAELVFKQ